MNSTIGREFNTGKVAQVECIENDSLKTIKIQNECFLLLMITEGVAVLKVDNQIITATAPCFVETISNIV